MGIKCDCCCKVAVDAAVVVAAKDGGFLSLLRITSSFPAPGRSNNEAEVEALMED